MSVCLEIRDSSQSVAALSSCAFSPTHNTHLHTYTQPRLRSRVTVLARRGGISCSSNCSYSGWLLRGNIHGAQEEKEEEEGGDSRMAEREGKREREEFRGGGGKDTKRTAHIDAQDEYLKSLVFTDDDGMMRRVATRCAHACSFVC